MRRVRRWPELVVGGAILGGCGARSVPVEGVKVAIEGDVADSGAVAVEPDLAPALVSSPPPSPSPPSSPSTTPAPTRRLRDCGRGSVWLANGDTSDVWLSPVTFCIRDDPRGVADAGGGEWASPPFERCTSSMLDPKQRLERGQFDADETIKERRSNRRACCYTRCAMPRRP